MKQAVADHFFASLPKTNARFHEGATFLHQELQDQSMNSHRQLWQQQVTQGAEMYME